MAAFSILLRYLLITIGSLILLEVFLHNLVSQKPAAPGPITVPINSLTTTTAECSTLLVNAPNTRRRMWMLACSHFEGRRVNAFRSLRNGETKLAVNGYGPRIARCLTALCTYGCCYCVCVCVTLLYCVKCVVYCVKCRMWLRLSPQLVSVRYIKQFASPRASNVCNT